MFGSVSCQLHQPNYKPYCEDCNAGSQLRLMNGTIVMAAMAFSLPVG
tara:strand:- start:611 stop:751 length:141 start_codon:yes stop_codon:yes gene_type:complete